MDTTKSLETDAWECPQCTIINKRGPDCCEVCFYNRKEETENLHDVQRKLELVKSYSEEAEEEVIRVVIVGKTGNGKSSIARSLTGSEKFQPQLSATSSTRNCMYDSGYVDDVRMEVVDTPGLFDTCLSNKESIDHISKCCLLSAPGPHAFLVTLGFQRFTPEESKALEMLEKLFGKEFYRYVVIVFTGYDSLVNSKSSVDFFIRNIPESLQKVIDSCNGRHTYIDNTDTVEDSKEGARRIIGLVKEIKNGNPNGYFSNDLLNKVESHLVKKEKEIYENEEFYVDNGASRGEFGALYSENIVDAKRWMDGSKSNNVNRKSREIRNKVRRDIVDGKLKWITDTLYLFRPIIINFLYENRHGIAKSGFWVIQKILRL